jgi:uncharacterized protein (DUF697 family)
MSDPTNESETGTTLVETSETTRNADALVKTFAVGSAIIGAIPVAPVVMVLLLALNLTMLYRLSQLYGVTPNKDLGKAAIYSFIAACGAGAIGGRVKFGLSTVLPFAGQFIRGVTVPLFAAGLTYGVGKLFTQHFASGGTFLNFKPEEVREHFYAEFQNGTKMAEEAEVQEGAPQPTAA